MEYLNKIFNLENKIAVITGGSGIIGSEIAKGLLSAGAKVVLLARDETTLNEKVEQFQKINKDIIALKCNVLEEENIKEANKKILDRFSRIDILINAAGGNIPGATIGVDQSVFDIEINQFEKVTDLNLKGLSCLL